MKKLIATVLILLAAPTAFAGGPESGGGGNVCALSSGPKALDIAGSNEVHHWIRLGLTMSQQIRFTARDLKVRIVRPSGGVAAGVTLVLRDLVQAGYGSTAQEIKQALNDLQIAAVPKLPVQRAVGADFRDFKNGECSAANTKAAIYYNWRLGIVIDANAWNQLKAVDQVTLLIHEALRNIQIRYRQGFSDHLLQVMTKTLMNGDTSSFMALYNRVRLSNTARIELGGLCSIENAQVAQKISPIALRLKQACRTRDARDVWSVMASLLAQPGSRYLYVGGDVDQGEYERFTTDLMTAYQKTAGLETQRLSAEILWMEIENVYNLQNSMFIETTDAYASQAQQFTERLAQLMK